MLTRARRSAAISVALLCVTSLTQSQARGKPNATSAAALAAVTAIPTWQPIGQPVAISVAPGERIVLKNGRLDQGIEQDPAGMYAMLENRKGVFSNVLSSRPLHRQCAQVSVNKVWCIYKLGTAEDFAPGIVLHALIDMSPNANTSEIITLRDIGTLTVLPNGNAGLQQTWLNQGQSLALANNQTLVVTTQGWGARYYVLMSGGQQINKWPAERLLVDGTLRLRLVKSIGWHRPDDWGIEKSTLMNLK